MRYGLLSDEPVVVVESIYDGWSTEAVVEAIDHGLETLLEFQEKLVVLESAKRAEPGFQQRVLALSRQHRQAAIDRFKVEGALANVIATESIDQPHSLVLALEAEENDSKGIIAKLIDAIVDAFKWLWEKLSGLFSNSEQSDNAAKAVKALEDRFEEAVKAGKAFEAGAALEAGRYAKAFGHLGTSAALGTVEPLVKQHQEYKKAICDTLEELSKALKDAGSVATLFKSDTPADQALAKYTEYANKVDAAIKKNIKTAYSANEHGAYGFLKQGTEPVADKSVVMGPILSRGGPAMLGILLTGAVPKLAYRAANKTQKGKAPVQGFKLTLPGKLEEMRAFMTAVGELRKANAAVTENINRQLSGLKTDLSSIQDTLKGMKSAKMSTKEATQVVTGFANYIKSLGLIEVALGAAVQSTDASRELFEHIVSDAIALSKGEKPAEDAQGEAKPAEGEAKPAEGQAAPAAAPAAPAQA